jgi:hypothetical protein
MGGLPGTFLQGWKSAKSRPMSKWKLYQIENLTCRDENCAGY